MVLILNRIMYFLNHDEEQMVEAANYQDYGTVELFTDWLNRGLKEFKN